MKKCRGLKISRGTARKQLWTYFSLFIRLRDKRKNGGRCMVGAACHGHGQIECAYHLVPQQRGDAIRYCEDAVVGACAACNYGEFRHRSLYRDKHLEVFGKDRVEDLEARARQIVKLSTAQIVELRDHYKRQLEAR